MWISKEFYKQQYALEYDWAKALCEWLNENKATQSQIVAAGQVATAFACVPLPEIKPIPRVEKMADVKKRVVKAAKKKATSERRPSTPQ